MAVENKFLNADLGTGKLLDSKSNGSGHIKSIVVTGEIAAADDNGSKYGLFLINSGSGLFSLEISCDAITNGTDFDIGIYQYKGNGVIGDVVDKDLFLDGQTLASALDKSNALLAPDINELHKAVWAYAALGLSEDPEVQYAVVLTGNVVGSAAGTVTVHAQVLA